MNFPLDAHGQPPGLLNAARRIARAVDELLGLCKGVILDGVVSEDEAIALHQWIDTHREVSREWPADVLADRLDRIFEDAIVTDEERDDLKHLLEQIAGGDPETVALGNLATTLPLDDPPPNMIFEDHAFCFTGRFFFGTRRACTRAVEQCGGEFHKFVRLDTDYVVIGLIGSRDWLHSSYGRKIQKAVEYKRRGVRCAIVSEKHWASFIP